MDADLDLSASPFTARLTISCPSGRGTPVGWSQTRRSSRSVSRRRSWGSRPTGGSSRSRASGSRTCSRRLPASPAYFKRRRRLADTIEWLIGVFASQSPGFEDDLLLIDSTPVECAAAAETVRRSAARRRADYGYCAATPATSGASGCTRLRARRHPASARPSPRRRRDEREVALTLLARCARDGGETIARRQGLRRPRVRRRRQRPRRHDRPRPAARTNPERPSPRPDPPTDRVDLLDLQRPAHPRTPRRPHPPRPQRTHLQRFLALAACITLNHQLGRPSRALVDYVA